MKNKKNNKKFFIILILLTILLIVPPDIFINKVNASGMAEVLSGIRNVAGGILLVPTQYLLLSLALVIQTLLSAALTIGTSLTSIPDAAWVGMDQILFHNQHASGIKMVSIDFFNLAGGTTLNQIVGKWYYILRTISIAALFVVLIYVAIRILMASTGESKSKYKVMVKDWVVALALNFFIHYIMVAIVAVNETLVEMVYNLSGSSSSLDPITKVLGAAAIPGITGFLYTIAYILLVVFILRLLIIYINRMITMAFLTIMGPLLTITYPIEKMHSGNAKGFNTWLKDYIYNVLIQVFDCIIYIVLIDFAMSQMWLNPILGLALIASMFSLRKWVGKVFGLDQASTIGNAAGVMGAAMAAIGLSSGGAAALLKKNGLKGASGAVRNGVKNAAKSATNIVGNVTGTSGKTAALLTAAATATAVANTGKSTIDKTTITKERVSSPDSGNWKMLVDKMGKSNANPLNALNGRWAEGMKNYDGKGKKLVNFAGDNMDAARKLVLPLASGIVSVGMGQSPLAGFKKGEGYNKDFFGADGIVDSGKALTASAMRNMAYSQPGPSSEEIKQHLQQAVERYQREEGMSNTDKQKLNITIQAAVKGKEMPSGINDNMQELYTSISNTYSAAKAQGYDDDDSRKITASILNSTIKEVKERNINDRGETTLHDNIRPIKIKDGEV